jgi:hypothetical protein
MARPAPGLQAAPGFGAPLPQVPKMPKLSGIEKRAMGFIKDPTGYQNARPAVIGLIRTPTPKMQMHLDYNPALKQQHQFLQRSMGIDPNAPQVLPATPQQEARIRELDRQKKLGIGQFKPVSEAGIIPGVPQFHNPVLAWGQRALGGFAQSMVNAGPGLAAAAIGTYHHPLGEPKALAKATGESMLGMVTHPGREFITNPSEGLTNLFTVASLGAGSFAKAGTIADAARGLQTGELTPLQAGLKVLHPKIFERNVKILPGNAGVRVRPPAFKSALGGYAQTKLFDPLTEKLIDARTPPGQMNRIQMFNREWPTPNLAQKWAQRVQRPPVPSAAVRWAERHGGKLLERDVTLKTAMERGAAEVPKMQALEAQGKLPPGFLERGPGTHQARVAGRQAVAEAQQESFAEGALKSHANLHHSLYNYGAGAAESLDRDPNAYFGVNRPTTDQYGPKDLAKYATSNMAARTWNQMIEKDPEKLKANPDAYSYIPKATWDRLKLEAGPTGKASDMLNLIDRANQMVRSGRFMHPGYAAWAVQNGILHLSQAGPFIFRNAWQHRNELSRLSPEDRAMFENAVGAGHFSGGIARSYGGDGESSFFKDVGGAKIPFTEKEIPSIPGAAALLGKFKGATTRMAGFWHRIDDKYWREMSMIHELNRKGYHSAEDWSKLMHDNPVKFRTTGHEAQNEAINYSEMSPTERQTLAKTMTAWGWTRGATSYSLRFPFQHPYQAQALSQIGRQGQAQVDKFYSDLGGMAPSWLRGYLPLGHGNHPSLLGTSDINPGETAGSLIQSLPTPFLQPQGPHDPLITQFGPATQGIYEALSGHDPYGKALPGNAGEAAAGDILKRFTPLSYLNVLAKSKKGGGTFQQGLKPFLESEFGIPVRQLANPKQTAALGMKDWETSLPKPAEIQFRYNTALKQLPQELNLFKQRNGGVGVGSALVSKLKGDLEAVEQRDMYQYKVAQSKGANSFRTLPAVDRANAGIEFMLQHKYISPSDAAGLKREMSQYNTEPLMNQFATTVWGGPGIGSVVSQWKSAMKQLQPAPLTTPRG